jgi:UDP-N-acetylmuramate--alanine ligase
VVAVGGSAMSGIATVLVAMGHRVSGSDLRDSPRLERLRELGVAVTLGHDAHHVPAGTDTMIVSSAIGDDNPEVAHARATGIRLLRRADAQRAIVATRRAVAVAGSHGKTTTTSMLALVLREAGRDPSFLVGGDVPGLGATAAWREGEWIVVEADESDGTFLELAPESAIVTAVEADHLSYFGDVATLERAFERFVAAVPGVCLLCADDAIASKLASHTAGSLTYGFSAEAAYRITAYQGGARAAAFTLEHDGVALGRIELAAPGRHNVTNAAAATVMALQLGVPFDAARRALAGYQGVDRRYQFRGERDGVTFVDDYAHLPTEVSAMIDAAREGEWRRIVAVFQPHRYTRTAALWRDFADAFVGADVVVITDVYGFDETPIAGVSGHLVVRAVLDAHPELSVVYLPERGDLETHVPRLTRAGDLVLTLGAGDLTDLPDAWLGPVATGGPG